MHSVFGEWQAGNRLAGLQMNQVCTGLGRRLAGPETSEPPWEVSTNSSWVCGAVLRGAHSVSAQPGWPQQPGCSCSWPNHLASAGMTYWSGRLSTW